jgi:hypothetical protein
MPSSQSVSDSFNRTLASNVRFAARLVVHSTLEEQVRRSMRRSALNRPKCPAGGSPSRVAAFRGWLIACPILLCVHFASAEEDLASRDGAASGERATEFFLQNDAPVAENREFFLENESESPASTDDPRDFFMVNETVGAADEAGEVVPPTPSDPLVPKSTPLEYPEPLMTSENWDPSPVPGSSAPMTPPLEYAGGGPNWSTIPSEAADCPPGGPGQVLYNCRCAHQLRWVNWRLGSDYLEGCIPDGYNAYPLINTTSPSVIYSTPLHASGFVEPGGMADVAAVSDERLRRPMTELTTDIATSGLVPDSNVVALAERFHSTGTHRGWAGMAYYWDASHLAHQPLYFQDVNLERHGYSHGLVQPVVSAARFAGQFVLWPYALGARPHHEVEYTLGECRPGSDVPYVRDRPQPSSAGAALEAAVVTGLIFAVP